MAEMEVQVAELTKQDRKLRRDNAALVQLQADLQVLSSPSRLSLPV